MIPRILLTYGVAVLTVFYLMTAAAAILDAWDQRGGPSAVIAALLLSGLVSVLIGAIWGKS
jgi:hypothetical protein